jgi:hypothetical protein
MNILNCKPVLIALALCMSGGVIAQAANTGVPSGPNATPSKAGAYDCFGSTGVALRHCMDLNAAAASAGSNTPSASHDCGGMTGAALATCRELNGEAPAPMVNNNPGAYGNNQGVYGAGTPGYVAPGTAPEQR